MASLSIQEVPAAAHSAGTGPWLGRLPLEVREVVYQYMLVEKLEHRMKSAEYDHNRDTILEGLDHTSRFHTAILRTNSVIYREANHVFHRDNLMVCLQLRQCDFSGSQLQHFGFQPFAKYWNTENLPAVAMTMAFGPHPTARDFGALYWESENYVFDSADLPAVCTSLLRLEARGHGSFTGGPLQVTVDASIGERLRESRDGVPHPHSRLRTLLDPLRRLHGLDGVQVDGPGSTVYKDEIIASMSERRNAKETMKQALLAAARGDKASEVGDLSLAIDLHKAGLEFSRGNTPDPWSEVTQRAMDDTTVRLQTRIAAAYLRWGRLRMARIYAERVYGPHHDYDMYRHHKHKFPLQVEADRGPLFAKLLVVAAQISYAHGKVDEALDELRNAIELDADCQEAQALQSQYEERWEQLQKRKDARQQAQDRQAHKLAGDVTAEDSPYVPPLNWGETGWERLDESGEWVSDTVPYDG